MDEAKMVGDKAFDLEDAVLEMFIAERMKVMTEWNLSPRESIGCIEGIDAEVNKRFRTRLFLADQAAARASLEAQPLVTGDGGKEAVIVDMEQELPPISPYAEMRQERDKSIRECKSLKALAKEMRGWMTYNPDGIDTCRQWDDLQTKIDAALAVQSESHPVGDGGSEADWEFACANCQNAKYLHDHVPNYWCKEFVQGQRYADMVESHPIEPQEVNCKVCGQSRYNGWKHAYYSGYGDSETLSCSAPSVEQQRRLIADRVREPLVEDVAMMIWSFNLEHRPMKQEDQVDIWPEEDEARKHTYRLIAELAVKIARKGWQSAAPELAAQPDRRKCSGTSDGRCMAQIDDEVDCSAPDCLAQPVVAGGAEGIREALVDLLKFCDLNPEGETDFERSVIRARETLRLSPTPAAATQEE